MDKEHNTLDNTLTGKTVLITGGSRRIGAAIATCLHQQGMNIALHYRSAQQPAQQLHDQLSAQRRDSVVLLQGDLLDSDSWPRLVEQATQPWGRLDVLINNASSFYATPVKTASEADWENLLGSNLKAPFFLTQAAVPQLQKNQGSIINLVDIHAEKPRDKHAIYSIAKAGLVMLTKALAWELRPHIRVNAIAPGAILWSETGSDDAQTQADIMSRIPLQRLGDADVIAATALFLLRDGHYINGQTIAVDGGRSLFM